MDDTKDRILSEAEKLFAQQGYASTSIRQIISKAKANLAAIHYHFGSKEALFFEIVRRYLEGLNRQRLLLLEKELAACKNETPSVRNIVTAFLKPISEMHQSGSETKQFSLMLGRAFSEDPVLKRKISSKFFKDISVQFINAFHLALPMLGQEEIYWRFHFMVSTMVGSLMAPDRLAYLSNNACQSEDIREMVTRLTHFVVGGMEFQNE